MGVYIPYIYIFVATTSDSHLGDWFSNSFEIGHFGHGIAPAGWLLGDGTKYPTGLIVTFYCVVGVVYHVVNSFMFRGW